MEVSPHTIHLSDDFWDSVSVLPFGLCFASSGGVLKLTSARFVPDNQINHTLFSRSAFNFSNLNIPIR